MKIHARGKTAEILIYQDIGEGWFGGLSAKRFAEELKALGALERIDVRINSYGGSVFDGLAIYNTLRANGARIFTHVDGIAASIASLIAQAGDERHIAENGWMMIHDPWGIAMGNAQELRREADLLDGIRDTIAATYGKQASITLQEIQDMMAAETWLNSEDALDKGFVSHLAQASQAAAWDPQRLARFKHPPTAQPRVVPVNAPTRIRAAAMNTFITQRGMSR